MSAVAEKSWTHDIDERFRKRFAVQDAGQKYRDLNGAGDSHLRQLLAEVQRAEGDRAAMQAHVRDLQRQIDNAVSQHERTTTPLQIELNDPDTTPERRVEARAAVIVANDTLEGIVGPLQKLVEAAEEELQIVSAKAGGRLPIENAWVNNMAGEQKHRLAVLRKITDLLDPLVDRLARASRDADDALAKHREKLRKVEDGYGSRQTWHSAESIDFESRAKFASDLHSEFANFLRAAQVEADQIRSKRLKQLYS
jgi:hypothetical protein